MAKSAVPGAAGATTATAVAGTTGTTTAAVARTVAAATTATVGSDSATFIKWFFCRSGYRTGYWRYTFNSNIARTYYRSGINKVYVGVNDTALIIPESDGTFVWYRDKNDKDGDYYSGEYKLYIGDDAVEYLTTESEVKDNVTEDDIKELEAPEYGATRDNFVCLVLTNNKEVYYGEEHTYEGDDRVTTTLYGYFVNDKQGYKLTLVKYDNPYEFNLSPEEK